MSHEVFISFAFKDEEVAGKIHSHLQDRGIDCFWCNDLPGGAKYVTELGRAIRESKALLLVFSLAADSSDSVINEVTIAHNNRIPRIPLRLENVLPVNLEYVLANSLFFDVFPKPLEYYLPQLVADIRKLLEIKVSPGESDTTPHDRIEDRNWHDTDKKDFSQWLSDRIKELDSGRTVVGKTFIYRRNKYTGKYQKKLKHQK
jgi:hypothetical protein